MAVKSNDIILSDLLRAVECGKSQLPDFQRSWVWDDTRICKLIESLTSGFPMGAAMFLEYNAGTELQFKYRLFEGVDSKYCDVIPDALVLDGQQRLTTLFQVFMSPKAVLTRSNTGKSTIIKRYYYLDIVKALDSSIDRLEAIISIPESKIKTEDIGRKIALDLSSREKEYENMMFPLNLVFSETIDWLLGLHRYNPEAIPLFQEFQDKILKPLGVYTFPIITLSKDTSPEAVCQIFENVNTGGVTLTVFELITAKFAAVGGNLRDDWATAKKELLINRKDDLLKSLSGSHFLSAMTLLISYTKSRKGAKSSVSCKKKDILRMEYDNFKEYFDILKQGFTDAANFLIQQGIFKENDIPYYSQLIPLAAIFAYDNIHSKFLHLSPHRVQLERWFWCGVFGELYGAATETRFALDIVDVFEWLNNKMHTPDTISRSTFDASRLLTLRSRNSAAYKGLVALINRRHPRDFVSGQDISLATYLTEGIDIHHIFPQAYCDKKGLPQYKWNSIINKTPIYASSNRSIGGKAPSLYLQEMKNKGLNEEAIDEALISHQIQPNLLRTDDFDTFMVDRAKSLIALVEQAMGKPVSGRDSEEVIKEFGQVLNKDYEDKA